jgi:hypothetical protein
MNAFIKKHIGNGPIIAVANHAGHELRPEIAALMALNEADRLCEEDPYTDEWAAAFPTHILMQRSRFEVDLNRSRDTAVYRTPDDAWGLDVWNGVLPDEMVDRSLGVYDEFYETSRQVFVDKADKHGLFVALDLHSYNHKREGPDGPEADPEANPEVNVGTGTMNRDYWAPVVDRFIADLRDVDFLGRKLDVRENVKFVGRQFPQWTHTHFPMTGCVLAVEFKKFFMNEWTGEVDIKQSKAIKDALANTITGILASLAGMGARP